jgi:Fe2+ transport system protein FeoA
MPKLHRWQRLRRHAVRGLRIRNDRSRALDVGAHLGNLAEEDLDEKPDMTLREASRGVQVRIAGFDVALGARHREYLRAYGLEPGGTIEVIQQHPVTVVQVEHTELALDGRIAAHVLVTEPMPGAGESVADGH